MGDSVEDRVLQAVREAAPDGRLTCAKARELAGELRIPLAVVGQAANQLQIKIRECQLGCFK